MEDGFLAAIGCHFGVEEALGGGHPFECFLRRPVGTPLHACVVVFVEQGHTIVILVPGKGAVRQGLGKDDDRTGLARSGTQHRVVKRAIAEVCEVPGGGKVGVVTAGNAHESTFLFADVGQVEGSDGVAGEDSSR